MPAACGGTASVAGVSRDSPERGVLPATDAPLPSEALQGLSEASRQASTAISRARRMETWAQDLPRPAPPLVAEVARAHPLLLDPHGQRNGVRVSGELTALRLWIGAWLSSRPPRPWRTPSFLPRAPRLRECPPD